MIRIQVITFFTLASVILFTSAYAEEIFTKGDLFPNMYSEQPRSILVLPPINKSTNPAAPEYYMATIAIPLTLTGYYVFPVELVSEMLKQENIYDTDLLYTRPLNTFGEDFGADAVLYTRIKKWGMTHTGLLSRLLISFDAAIVSTNTSEQLWKESRTVMVDLSGENTSTTGSAGLLIKSMTTDADSVAADSVSYAHKANSRLIESLPFGPYHENYLQDQEIEVK
jgi:hypothetical protein